MKKKNLIILVAVLAIFCIAAGVLYQQSKPATVAGEKEITVTVVHKDGSEKEFTYTTDAEYLGDILSEKGLIDGEKADYGMYVKTVDGETIDESKQEWWCLTKDGGTVNTGVDQTPIANGDKYELTLTVGY